MTSVVMIGTLDTKGEEYSFLRDEVSSHGCDVVMVNAGVLGEPDYPVDISRHEVARAAGGDLDEIEESGDRGAGITLMARGAAAVAGELLASGRLDGLIGAAGSGGSAIISAAMRSLPVGVPKLLVSTMASGDVRPYTGTSDIALMYSVVDVAGINSISREVLANAAAAIAGMAENRKRRAPVSDRRPIIGATMYGTTTPCVTEARHRLEADGYEVLVFHATGAGGRSMESLMASGHITAALDVTTTELMDELTGGTMTAGPDRLEMAGSLGLPQVVSVGAVDQITFTPPDTVLAAYQDRTKYSHNPSVTLVRSNPQENARFGRLIAEKLNQSNGAVTVFLPLRGFSQYGAAGGVFHDPDADEALITSIKANLHPAVELVELDMAINDPGFGLAMAEKMHEHYQTWAASVLAGGEEEMATTSVLATGTTCS